MAERSQNDPKVTKKGKRGVLRGHLRSKIIKPEILFGGRKSQSKNTDVLCPPDEGQFNLSI